MRCREVLLLLVLLAGCDRTVPTPPGVLADIPTATKTSITEWTIGAPKAPPVKVQKTFHYVLGDLGPDVRFRISFQHGPAELVDAKPNGAPPPPVAVPSAIRFEVLENPRWAMSVKCDDDLKVPLDVNPDGTAAYPKSVWQTCTLVLKRKNGDITVAPWIEVHGDGTLTVKAIGLADQIVEEP